MRIVSQPYPTIIERADKLIATALDAGRETIYFDLAKGDRVDDLKGFAVFLDDETTEICECDHDGSLTLAVARWLQTLPIVGDVRPYVAATVESVTERDVTIRLGAFIHHEIAFTAHAQARRWGKRPYEILPGGLEPRRKAA